MNKLMLDAAEASAKGQLAMAQANITVYIENAAGIGEHGDVMETLMEQIDAMSQARDRLETIQVYRLFMNRG